MLRSFKQLLSSVLYGNVNTGEFGRKFNPNSIKRYDLVPPVALPVSPSLLFDGVTPVPAPGTASPDISVPSPPLPIMPRDTGATAQSNYPRPCTNNEITNCALREHAPGSGSPLSSQPTTPEWRKRDRPYRKTRVQWSYEMAEGQQSWGCWMGQSAYYLRKSVVSPPHPGRGIEERLLDGVGFGESRRRLAHFNERRTLRVFEEDSKSIGSAALRMRERRQWPESVRPRFVQAFLLTAFQDASNLAPSWSRSFSTATILDRDPKTKFLSLVQTRAIVMVGGLAPCCELV